MKRLIARFLRWGADKLAGSDQQATETKLPSTKPVGNSTVADIKAARQAKPLPTEKERRELEQKIIKRLNLKPIETKKVTLDDIKNRHGGRRPGSKVRAAR